MVNTAPEATLQISRHLVRRFLVIFLSVGALLAGLIAVFYSLQTRSYLTRILDADRLTLRLQEADIHAKLEGVAADLGELVDSRPMRTLLDVSVESGRAALSERFLNHVRHHPEYDHVRFLDTTGMEVVRVDGDGAPEVVPQQRLQFKGNRYFFTDTLRLGPDQAYISPFDLNVDQGVVEVPYKPTIRFGTPVFDSSGRKRGVVVLNYLGARLIASLRRIAETSDGTPHLVNPEGYWLSSPDPAQEWGFMLPDRRDQRFDQAFPEAWEAIGRDDEGVVIGSFGAFVFTTIHPAAGLKMVSSTGSSEITGSSAASVSEASYTWKLVSHIPSDRLNADSRILLTRLFVLAAAMFVLIGLASWYVAQTSLQRALGRQRLRHQALHDGLTGLPNRVLFTDRLEQALRVARRTRTSCGVLFLDLDGFKQVNDTRGHAVGDLFLRSVAERLRGALRRSDTVARMGGDEFTVILPEIRTPEDARMVADKLVAFLALPFVLNGAEVRIGVSIGIACYPADGEEAESLLVQADAAMYEAKQCGKGTARAVRPLSPE